MKQNFPRLETKRLFIRQFTYADIYDLYNLFADPDVMKYDGISTMKSINEAENFINVFSHPNSIYQTLSIRWAVTEKSSGQFVGTCGFKNWNHAAQKAEVGSDLAKAFWNQGYGTEILPTLIQFGFSKMNLNRITALTNPKNIAAQRVLVKYGFQEEGYLRDYEKWNGRFVDSIIFSLLKREYKK